LRSQLVGRLAAPVIGLGLAAALLVPDADPRTMASQGLARLLTRSFEDGALVEGSLFARIDAAADAGDHERLVLRSLTLARGDRPPRPVHDDPEFRRAVASAANLLDARRRERGAPPLALVGETPGVLLDLRLSEADGTLRLDATLDGEPAPPIEPWREPTRASVVPPLLAIFVALLLRRTILALFVGIWVGATLILVADGGGVFGSLFAGLVDVVTVYFWAELTDTFRIEIIGFVIALVAMVGVMSRAGGVQGLITSLLGFARSVRSTLAVTFGMGVLIFFDDYANCLLVGNTMRPLADRMRISREKLAYVVDSTAAPIAGISLLSTWIAFEVSTYAAQLPGVGITESAYAIFLQTIPFRFYCLFTLLFVVLNVTLGRDYGPMHAAETRARTTGALVREGSVPMVSESMTRIEPEPTLPQRARDAALPIACVLLVTLGCIFEDGGGFALLAEDPGALLTLEGVTGVLYGGSGAAPIFVGAVFGYLLAVFLAGSARTRVALAAGTLAAVLLETSVGLVPGGLLGGALGRALDAQGGAMVGYLGFGLVLTAVALATAALAARMPARRPHLPWGEISRASLSSTAALFFAVVILFEAWMIGAVCGDIGTADYLVALLSGNVDASFLPVLLFLVAVVVAFSTGTSWSTMSILLPNVVALAASVGAEHPIGSTGMVVVCIGAVLEGSIFGDHCSPISDTTVLSSVSSASDHIDHVRTQAPYALTTGTVAILAGYLPTLMLDWWSFPFALGTAALVLGGLLLLVGRRVADAPAAVAAGGRDTGP